MNFIDDNTFSVRLTMDRSSQVQQYNNVASYKQELNNWVNLTKNDYLVGITELSIPIYNVDMTGNRQCYIEVIHTTANGHVHRAKCVFRRISESNPSKFVTALNQQIIDSPSMQTLFAFDLPSIGYDSKTHQASIHLGVVTPDGHTDMMMSDMLCRKLGFTQAQLPFIGEVAEKPPIVAKSINPVFLYEDMENIYVSLPSLISHGILINSLWTSIGAIVPVDYTRLATPVTYIRQFQQIKRNIIIERPTFHRVTAQEIRHWKLELLLDNMTPLEWISDVSVTITLAFKRAPSFETVM